MVDIELTDVSRLRHIVENTSIPVAERSLAVRRFCNEIKASAPVADRPPEDASVWTKVDMEHLLEISANMHALSNYLIERVVAAD